MSMKKNCLVFVMVFLLVLSSTKSQENITERQALEALLQTENDIVEMESAGFGTVYVNDILIEAKESFEGVNYTSLLKEAEKINDTEKRERAINMILEAQKVLGKQVNYTRVLEKTRLISDRKQQAYDISDSLRALELAIEEVDRTDLNTTEAEVIYNSALISFQNERYEETLDIIDDGYEKLNEIKAEATLINVVMTSMRENVVYYVKENWLAITIVVIVLAGVGYVVFDIISITRTSKKIKDLETEKEGLVDLIKEAQFAHFEKGILPENVYKIKMKRFKERMIEIDRLLPVLKARLKKSKRKNKAEKKNE